MSSIRIFHEYRINQKVWLAYPIVDKPERKIIVTNGEVVEIRPQISMDGVEVFYWVKFRNLNMDKDGIQCDIFFQDQLFDSQEDCMEEQWKSIPVEVRQYDLTWNDN